MEAKSRVSATMEGQIIHFTGEHGVGQVRVRRVVRSSRDATVPALLKQQRRVAHSIQGEGRSRPCGGEASFACLARSNAALGGRAPALT